MGAAASSGSDTTPANDLAASFESWVTSGGDRCAAAIAALEAASPALAAALRSADADAVRGALAAAADAAEANNLAPRRAATFRRLLREAQALQATVYDPERGRPWTKQACAAARSNGGFWGPFLP